MKEILIVDDEMELLNMLVMRFSSVGYKVSAAQNGEEALRHIQNAAIPDIIVLDEMMPVMDGFKFLKIIKADEKYSKIPVIILTARSRMRDSFLSLDADLFMSKPFETNELLANVATLLDQRDKPVSSARRIIMTIEKEQSGLLAPLVEYLKQNHYDVQTVENASDLVGRTVVFNPSMIIIPCIIKGQEVAQIIRLLKGMKEAANAVFVAYSYIDRAHKAPGLSQQLALIDSAKKDCMEAGANEFISEIDRNGLEKVLQKYFIA